MRFDTCLEFDQYPILLDSSKLLFHYYLYHSRSIHYPLLLVIHNNLSSNLLFLCKVPLAHI
jgi:hypothetical protein